MICLRCNSDKASVVSDAPDGSFAWQICACPVCNYHWRTTEPKKITDPSCRDVRFNLTEDSLKNLGRFV